MAKAVQKYMKYMGIFFRPVLTYAPMSNGRAERMAGTIEHSKAKIISSTNQEIGQAQNKMLCGYRRRELNYGYPPFELLYGTRPRMQPSDSLSMLSASNFINPIHENLACSVTRAHRVDQEPLRKTNHRFSHTFELGD